MCSSDLAESAAIRSVWPLQYFPPLFPLLLAFTGAAHSLLMAHALVVALGALALLHALNLRFQPLDLLGR